MHHDRPLAVDITELVSVGANSLVVLAHHYGAGVINGRIMSHIPGLTSLLVADNVTVLQTAPSWRCTNETEYLPSPGAWSSIPDVIDARAPVQGWTAPSYDDSAWGVAAPVDGTTWGDLFPRAMPLAAETALPLSDLTLMPAGPPLAAALPLTLAAGQSAVIDLGSMAMVYADLALWAPAAGAVLNLDYALRFVDGSPRETYGAGSTLTTRAGAQRLFGGGMWEASSYCRAARLHAPCFSPADQWCSHYMIISVQVHSPWPGLASLPAPDHTLCACACMQTGNVTITNVSMVARSYPFSRLGSFASSDAQLTAIWERAVNTLAVVTDDAYGERGGGAVLLCTAGCALARPFSSRALPQAPTLASATNGSR